MSSLADRYAEALAGLLPELRQRNQSTLRAAAAALGPSLARGGVLHCFGSGHSAVLAREMVHRAGGLAAIGQILDPADGWFENLPGYGTRLAEVHDARHGLQPGEGVLVVSNSGKNASPLEVALFAKARGLLVVALTSVATARLLPAEHPSGQRLHEIADFTLDNGGRPGDALLSDPALPQPVGPTSTIAGAFLLNLLHLEIMDWWRKQEIPLPLLQSGNSPGGKEFNRGYQARYRHRLAHPL